jgi:cysteine desulfurase/selenocysteine lyase
MRADFPILSQTAHGKPLIFLDSAASSQKPKQVIDAISHFYAKDYANVHRGIYELSAHATVLYEETRDVVRQFINATYDYEIIFVSGTTEGINLVAQSLGRTQWRAGDEVILTEMEHHSNIVPWYLLKEQIGIDLKIIPINQDGSLDLTYFEDMFNSRTKMLAVTHTSNVLGTINPIKRMVEIAHRHGVPVLVDGAQAVPHMPVNVADLNCDFYVFSAHKTYGPTGIGVLCGKKAWLKTMPPYQGGGDMIETVAFDKVTYAALPHQFEAGTPHIAGVIGMRAAIEYLNKIGMDDVYDHEQTLLAYTLPKLLSVPGIRLIGTMQPKVGVISFVMDEIHAHDIGTVLDFEGIAIRAGHHCAMPLMQRYNVPATVRASFGIYNNEQDIDQLIAALHLARRLLG